MSKYSYQEYKARQLERELEEQAKNLPVEEKDDLTIEEAKTLPEEVFTFSAYDETEAERGGYSNYSYWRSTFRMFFRNKVAVAMLALMCFMLLFTFLQPFLPNQFDPNMVCYYKDYYPELNKSGFIKNQQPDATFWFGTNEIGQDLWSRLWQGTRTSLFIGIVVAAIEAALGIIAGLIWGYVRKLDFLFTEIYNLLNNIPTTIVLILATYVMKPSISTLIIAMSVTGWIGLARFIRNQVLVIRDRDFNLASRCLGTPTGRVIMKNLLPQMVSVVMLRMALAIPGAIGSEVFLAYIGLGLPIDVPSLGNLVNKGRALMMSPSLRYQLWFPAIILSVITICFYLIGNAFADAADPKNHV